MNKHWPRLSAVPATEAAPKVDAIRADTYRLLNIEDAARMLHLAAVRLHAVPRYPEIADYRATVEARFEEAVAIMREALSDG